MFGSIISDVWNGRERLWAAFWIWHFALGIFLVLLGWSLVLQVSAGYGFPMLIAVLLHAIWSLVGLWRCAYNTDYRWLGHAARAWVVIYVALIAHDFYQRYAGQARMLPLPGDSPPPVTA